MLRVIAAILFAVALTACAASAPQPRAVPVQIDTVTTAILESDPVRLQVRLQGYLGDGCTSLGEIAQQRDGNTIRITVTGVHSGAEVCTAIAQILDETLIFDGPFAPGEVLVQVNGVETRVTI